MVEVEFKASLEGTDLEELERRLAALGFVPCGSARERDLYFNGAGRDFRRTDEALRLRVRTSLPGGEEESLLTYKGPKLDRLSSARLELETGVSSGGTAGEILRALGFVPAVAVSKVRRLLRLDDATVCLDEVEGLGSFIELETLVPSDSGREAAEARLLALLDSLGVPRAGLTRLSYLELLLLRKAGEGGKV